LDALAANFPGVAPFLQGSVVEVAGLMKLVLEKVNLGSVWVQTVFVSEAHLLSFLALDGLAHHGADRCRFRE
jgi:hypothetical protein